MAAHDEPVRGEINDRRSALVRVVYKLPSSDGWPPIQTERVWASPMSDDVVRIENSPWFVMNLALGDLVRTQTADHGELFPIERLRWSGNCNIRVVPYDSGPYRNDLQGVMDVFSPLGVMGEGVQQFGLVALTVPPTADLASIKAELAHGARRDWWGYDEGCIGEAWAAIEA